ncbi:HD domain-containing protein [Blastopirellula sp. JC732]|uniref:HD domain-containing protein n=1 Tax=Blastopirellula sediminis TaxID=2894196 RepID=A0A9X1MSL2_9BACT|nr:HD domain-containing protein [Blastopirellula sediminis]MCC9604943.1 HD domain-containing protein [Blastopirellula sediminis]MCC9631757.1 HD domain-containing protein [Blastopirellula sediminis]
MNDDPLSIATTLGDLRPGEFGDVYVQLVDRQERIGKNGLPYRRLEFRDDRRRVFAMIWNDSQWFEACQDEWKLGQHFKVRAIYHESHRGKELVPRKIRPVNEDDLRQGFDPTRCQPRSVEDPAELWDAALMICQCDIQDESLRQLVTTIYTEQREPLLLAPAALYHHHCYQGGLLEHSLSVAQTVIDLIERHRHQLPPLQDRPTCDLAIAGALLHDVGKLLEIDLVQGGVATSLDGQILGHVLMGRDLVRETGQRLRVSPDLLRRLELIVLTHQDYYADGDYRRPISCEALLVQQADRINSELQRFSAALASPGEGPVIPKDNPFRRAILRGEASPDAEANRQT